MNKYIRKIGFSIISAATLISCTGDFEEINTDPNNMEIGIINAYGMFDPLLYNGANAWQEYTWYWNNELVQFTAFTGGVTREEHRYKIADGNWSSVWSKYANFANNATHMYDLADEAGDDAAKAVATTLRVLNLYNLTDMFGDIPYSEAFQARKGGTTKPKFDSQKDVYEQMFAELEMANTLYASNPDFKKKEMDGMYGGDMAKWRKFNNSLYLRLLCRVCGRSEMNVGAKLTEIISNPDKYPVFTSNSDNATVHFTGIAPYQNYFATTLASDFTTSGRKLTRQLLSMTIVTEGNEQVYIDPRLPIYGMMNTSIVNNPEQIWKGTVSGCTREEQSEVDRGAAYLNHAVFCRPEATHTFMDYAEIQFIFAEAALRGLIGGGEAKAKEYYEAAITASLERWGEMGQYSEQPVSITSDDVTTFLTSELAAWDKAANKQQLIAEQKFLALFWIGMEAYHEIRRTGYPVLTIGAGTIYNDYVFPTRFAYCSNTVATNAVNVAVALERMGGDNNMKLPVWWSKQAIESGK